MRVTTSSTISAAEPSPYERLRERHLRHWTSLVPEHVQRLRWPAERLRQEREKRLRDLLRVAQRQSPWHRDRLRGVDPDSFGEDDLRKLSPMTKDDLMAHWDEIVTDRRLSHGLVERHLAGLTSDAYLLDEFHAVASGGSTGRRGVFIYGWEAWATAWAGFLRTAIWDRSMSPDMADLPNTIAMVAAQRATHMTGSMGQTFANPMTQTVPFPINRSLEEIVTGLNRFQPTMVLGYAAALVILVGEAREGRLRISPRRIISTSEPLLPEMRSSVEETFGAPVANVWGTSEAGPLAAGCWRGPGMHLCDDLVIVEPVDQRGQPVAPGTVSDKVYVTAISNPTLPLIRYELTDQVALLTGACPCDSSHRLISDVEGRLDDIFCYEDGLVVHPHVFRSVLGREPSVIEYQVRQTATGAAVKLCSQGETDLSALRRELASQLARLGMRSPDVSVTAVERIVRQATGKLHRFIPLGQTGGF